MKIYRAIFNDNTALIPHSNPALKVTAGKKTCFKIGFPTEGILDRFVISQRTSEVQVNATVELLCSVIPYPVGDMATGTTAADVVDHYRILTTALSVTAGTPAELNVSDFGQGYTNFDGSWTTNQRYAYLLINPSGAAADTHWNVTIIVRTDIQ